jgi:hypothetical protein
MPQVENDSKARGANRTKKTKFQADMVPSDERMLSALKSELELTSNSDFLSDAVALFRWAVAERRSGHKILSESASGERKILVFPRLERVAPEFLLPHVELEWSEGERDAFARIRAAEVAPQK